MINICANYIIIFDKNLGYTHKKEEDEGALHYLMVEYGCSESPYVYCIATKWHVCPCMYVHTGIL